MVDSPPARTSAGRLFPPCLQRAPHAGSAHLAEQESSLQAPVRRQRRNPAGGRRRSQTPRRGDRLFERLTYLGADAATAPPHTLRRDWRGAIAGSYPVDSGARSLLLASQAIEPRISRQVRGRPETRLPPGKARFLWVLPATDAREGILSFSAYALPRGLGGLCQAAIRRTGTRTALSGSLHSSRRDLQPSSCRPDRHPRLVSLEGLCASQQAPHHDTHSGGVPAPVSPTCSASRTPPHPLLRPPREPAPRRTAASLQDALTCTSRPRFINGYSSPGSVEVSLLSKPDAPSRAAYRETTSLGPKRPGWAP